MVWYPAGLEGSEGYQLKHSAEHEVKDWIMFSYYQGYRLQGREPYYSNEEIVDL